MSGDARGNSRPAHAAKGQPCYDLNVSADGLEKALADLSRDGTLVKDRGYRQVWRFEHAGRGYYLKFYPRDGTRDRIRRAFRGSPAVAEFKRLQILQRADVPSPRAVAVLMGFKIADRAGDAVIIEAIEPSVQVDAHFSAFELRGQTVPDRLSIARQIRDILRRLVRNRLGHEDLHLGNFLLKDGKVFLLDGYAVTQRPLSVAQLLYLGRGVMRFATRTDLLRGWYEVGPGGPLPLRTGGSELSSAVIRKRVSGENRYFGRIAHDGWTGSFFKLDKFPRRWSTASRLHLALEDWRSELPIVLDRIERDELKVLKRSRSGDVLATTITLAGQPMDVIVKRPKKRYWYRYVNEVGRGSRAWRAWLKAWKIIARNLPTAWPLLYMDKRHMGYVTDSLIIFERVPGPTLARADLDAIAPAQREMLFRRAGRILRTIERLGFSHFDAKSANWIVRPDEKLGPSPVMIDIDGIRERRWDALGIRRLLKSMIDHKQYTVDDSLALCRGYAPTAVPRLPKSVQTPTVPAAKPAADEASIATTTAMATLSASSVDASQDAPANASLDAPANAVLEAPHDAPVESASKLGDTV